MAKNQAIVIGINQYHFLQPLKYAKRDAEAMRDFLERQAGFDRVFLFTDNSPEIGGKSTQPFRSNIRFVLQKIFESPFMGNGDNFWFFFSGHGIRHNNHDYLMPSDGHPEDIGGSGISTAYITERLRNCGADNVVMILDACRSQGVKSGEGIGRQTEAEARQTGVISIFSCSPDQYSYEIEAIEQGAFTHALLEGLSIRGKCATVERLNQYLQNQVPQLVQQHLGTAKQTPYTIAEPLNRSHLILMPQYASLADIATLKTDAYRAQMQQNWDLAQRLWIRVLAAASGQDTDAIEALQFIAIQRPPLPPSPSPVSPDEKDLSSERFGARYYAKLRDLLKAGEWKKANQETAIRMSEVADRQGKELRAEDVKRFPSQDLRNIDRLWVKYSNGRFGFSVQKKIYLDCGAEPNSQYPGDQIWQKFITQLGWHRGGNWVKLSDFTFDPSAPPGHLPKLRLGSPENLETLLSRPDL